MVIKNQLFLLIFLIFLPLFPVLAQSVNVDASINGNTGQVQKPIKGTLSITHDQKDKIDPNSFEVDGKPLKSAFVQDVAMSSQGDVTVTIYNFELEPREEGAYVLPPISVKVGNKTYKSISSSYEIVAASKMVSTPAPAVHKAPALSPKTSATEEKKPIFGLAAFVNGPNPLYPGQRAIFQYRISYNQSIDLTESTLPLVYATEFRKIGDAHFKDFQENNLTIQDITQEYQALTPGLYKYGPSSITGNAYRLGTLNQKIYFKNKLFAEAPPVEVTVKAFPTINQPASFNGAVGPSLDAELQLVTPPAIHVGDSMKLELIVSGPSNLDEMTLPNLACQPGLSGFFELNDLPALARFKDNKKYFEIELRPISFFAKSVPSLEISSFNTDKEDYIVWRSKPIALKVTETKRTTQETLPFLQPVIPAKINVKGIIEKSNINLPPLTAFKTTQASACHLIWNWMQSPLVLFAVPFSALLLLWQWEFHRHWLIQRPIHKETSRDLLEKALKLKDSDLKTFLDALRKAIYFRLKEKNIDTLPLAVQDHLSYLDSVQYGYPSTIEKEDLFKKTGETIEKI